jgi:hypothetical protein
MGYDVWLYNSSVTEGEIWNVYLIPSLLGALGGAQFN